MTDVIFSSRNLQVLLWKKTIIRRKENAIMEQITVVDQSGLVESVTFIYRS